MKEKYLVINAGSSSLKFSLYEMPEKVELVNGTIERIGSEDSNYTLKSNGEKLKKSKVIMNHKEAVSTMIDELLNYHFIEDISEIKGIGHRIVHGGEIYSKSALIDENTYEDIKSFMKFAPLHLPGELAGIESMKEALPSVPQIAVFDTAFHQTIPEENYMYAVPYEWYSKYGVRRYGFHGTSHKYITEYMQNYFNKEDVNLIVCHIGSGASICCVKDGKSFDTTMGMTPLAGTVMGTRSGSIDPSIVEYISKENNIPVEEVIRILNNESGLLGISGKNDYRDVENLANAGDNKASLAIKLIEKSVVKYIGQYYFELNGDVDAIVFTAGLGENAINFREDIVNEISVPLNINLDKEVNSKIANYKDIQTGKITTEDSNIPIFVIPTDEEYMILKDTIELSRNRGYQRKLN